MHVRSLAADCRENNREKIREQDRDRYALNRDRRIDEHRLWYENNREDVLAKLRAREDDEREEDRRRANEWYENNSDRARMNTKKWREDNSDKTNSYSAKRRAIKRGVGAELISPLYVFERDGWICGICGGLVDNVLKWPDPFSASVDHIIPLARRGVHSLLNVQCSHLRCNLRKRASVLEVR